jgi:hypothetical protein
MFSFPKTAAFQLISFLLPRAVERALVQRQG